MDHHANTIQNSSLASLLASAPKGVVNAIKQASAKTGVNFAYLVQQAGAESSFKPNVKAKTSSAAGLYQFIESTWMNMVKKHGDKYGMGDLADKISDSGKVADKATRKQILALRNDPEKASAMAAEFARENEQSLNENWGGKVGSTELYFAHFMGAGQAAAFLKARDENPVQQAAAIFPAAAAANHNVFYDSRTGRAKTMDEVYAFFDKKFDVKDFKNTDIPGIDTNTTSVASNATQDPQQLIASNVFVGGVNRTNSLYHENGYTSAYTALKNGRNYGSLAAQNLVSNPAQIMMLSQLDAPSFGNGENSRNSSKDKTGSARFND